MVGGSLLAVGSARHAAYAARSRGGEHQRKLQGNIPQ